MNTTSSLASPALTASAALATVDRPAEINVFTMLVALGFPPDVAAIAARPDTFAR